MIHGHETRKRLSCSGDFGVICLHITKKGQSYLSANLLSKRDIPDGELDETDIYTP